MEEQEALNKSASVIFKEPNSEARVETNKLRYFLHEVIFTISELFLISTQCHANDDGFPLESGSSQGVFLMSSWGVFPCQCRCMLAHIYIYIYG